MTADERASKIVTDADWRGTDWVYDGTAEVPEERVDTGILHAQIAAAIRDAEAAAKADMRERAAQRIEAELRTIEADMPAWQTYLGERGTEAARTTIAGLRRLAAAVRALE
jgi:hypothetical protein